MKQHTFFEIIKDNTITVPIIQRDYVQGRDSHTAKKKIVDFIETIARHLKDGKILPLNFIYGYKDGENFIPIDGQQRLTTLYLLHLYVFKKAGEETDKLKKFSYFVRPSSNRFFSALLSNLDCLSHKDFEDEAPISKNVGAAKKYEDDSNDVDEFLKNCSIVKQNWFRKCWLNDLTVRSSIIVLYLIKESLNDADFKDLYNKLTVNPIIQFSYLPMNNAASADETYVKMNARGKQLTPFENLKADLYAYYKSNSRPSNYDDFKKNIDSSWLALALKLIMKKADTSDATEDSLEDIDSTIFAVFNVIQTNNMVVDELKDDRNGFVSNSVFNMRQSDIALSDYLPDEEECRKIVDAEKKYNESLSKSINQFALLMNYLIGFINSSNDRLLLVIKNISKIWGNEKDTQQYNERLIVFSLIKFLETVPNTVTDRDFYFIQWLKAFRHIIDHSEIDNQDKFINAIDNINKDLDFSALRCNSLYEKADTLFSSLKSPFNSFQIEDEKRKASYRIKSNDWEIAISEYEENEYFQGQSIFLSAPSKISSEKDYSKYWEKTMQVFEEYGKNNNPLLCLFASKGWLIQLDGKKSFSYGYYDDMHHTYDWRGIFENCDYVEKFIEILNDFILSSSSFADYVDTVTKKTCNPIPNYNKAPADFLKYVLSLNYNTYGYFKQGRYIFDASCCRLLKNTGTNIDDTLDLSIAYLLLKYKNEGWEDKEINYFGNTISMKKGAVEFTVSFNDSTSKYSMNTKSYSDINDVITDINSL